MYCITTYFNPAKYKKLLLNYHVFADQLNRQGVNLITIELSFDGSFDIPQEDNVYRLTSNSVMWQKERLINYGVSKLPPNEDKFAWVDCDVLFDNPNWANDASSKLDSCDIVQLFKRVYYLPNGDSKYVGRHDIMVQGVIWQAKTHRNWLDRRSSKELPFSSPGFAWAARKNAFIGGIYDKNIIGSGDTFLVDMILNSWEIHGFAKKFTRSMKFDMWNWLSQQRVLSYDFLPDSIYHLYHGSLNNRRYMDRHNILIEHNYSPKNDIILKNEVYEWNSNKEEMHNQIRDYFFGRLEDE